MEPHLEPSSNNSIQISALMRLEVKKLLHHQFFTRCHNDQIDRKLFLDILKSLYCFSVFFERAITRRVSNYSSNQNETLIQIARKHAREELGHPDLFRTCLLHNGLSLEDVKQIVPKTYTKAVFGYLLATVEYESEFVSNVAIMQVMETMGHHFFQALLMPARRLGMHAEVFDTHNEEDENHAALGLETYELLSPADFQNAQRVIQDMFILLDKLFTEWLGESIIRHEESH